MAKPFKCPENHRNGLEEVKRAVNIHHSYLDSWIYLFFENKNFNVKDTIDKLNRRDIMEKSVFSSYVLSPFTRASIRSGIVQCVGRDHEGRPVLYFNTCRDFPKADERDLRRENFDIFLSWAVRCCKDNPTSKVIWLINQKDTSFRKNMDLIFQKDMALRVSKFFPGVVAKMYLCNMSSALTLVFRPLLRQLPASISDCIFFFSGKDLAQGKLLEFIPEHVLPVAMGGKNNCDHPANYEFFAQNVELYFHRCIDALHSGISIKEMEIMEEYNVDRQGEPLSPSRRRDGSGAVDSDPSGGDSFRKRNSRSLQNGSPGTELLGSLSSNSICFPEHGNYASMNAISPEHLHQQPSSSPHFRNEDDSEESLEDSDNLLHSSSRNSPQHCGVSNGANYGTSFLLSTSPQMAISARAIPVERIQLPIPNFRALSVFPFRILPNLSGSARKNVDTLLRELCFYGEKLGSVLKTIMLHLRDGCQRRSITSTEGESDGTAMNFLLRQNAEVIAHVAHSLFCLFPPTLARLNYPIFPWLIDPVLEKETVSQLSPEWWGEASLLDCTSPDNLLLSLQTFAVEYIDDCDILIQDNITAKSLLTRLGNFWPSNLTCREVLELLHERCRDSWRILVPHFQQYIECKVALAIVEFIRFHGLLVSGGRIDVNAEWYQKLLWSMVQYREMRRKNYIFHVFPPLFRDHESSLPEVSSTRTSGNERLRGEEKKTGMNGLQNSTSAASSPPSPEELLGLRGLSVSFHNIVRIICLVKRSLEKTLHQLASPVTVNIAAHTVVERYLENTMSRISIAYETQRAGVPPPELAFQKQMEAYRCLEAAQAALTEYLFSLAATTWINEKIVGELPSKYHSWDFMMRQLQSELRDVSICVEVRQRSRLIANGLAAEAYNMQGSFASSAFSPELRTDEPPEGYAAALSLLFIASASSQLVGNKGDGTLSIHRNDGDTERSEIPSIYEMLPTYEVPNIREFIKIIHNIQKCTSSLLGEVGL